MEEWLSTLSLDIHTTIIVLVVSLVFAGGAFVYFGIRTLSYGFEVTYIKKRRKFIRQGWWVMAVALLIFVFAFFISLYGEPIIYQVYIPSPTITITPSITPSPTITLTMTISPTPTVTRTPSITPTPAVPDSISTQFSGTLEPGSNIVFSPITFSDAIDEFYQPIEVKTIFTDPVETVYGSFTYNNMQPGLQWTAIWRNPEGELICHETEVWGNFTGGYGYTECSFNQNDWIVGEYQVQMFLGLEWWQTNSFFYEEQPQNIETDVPEN